MGEAPQSNRAFFASVLIVIGLIWMTLTGLCTAGFLVWAFSGGGTLAAGDFLNWTMLIVAGGVGSAFPGLIIWLVGKALKRRTGADL
jgi:hypothetical protein